MKISVVVPTLDEERAVGETLRRAASHGFDELIVADGGSRDGTVDRARASGARVVTARQGRGPQMNAGAAAAEGDVLVFLHADTVLPDGARGAIERALADPRAVGGRFDLVLDAPGRRYRFLEWTINRRTRLTGIFTGDHALFVRAGVFREVGGFPDVPLFEDVAISRALKRAGRLVPLAERVRTSARRWETNGFLRTVFLMYAFRFAWFAGVSPHRLARWYAAVR